MTIDEITERVIRLPSGGIITDETRFDKPFVKSLINTVRGEVARKRFKETNAIHPTYYQRFFLEVDPEIQDNACFVRFSCPAPISLSGGGDGFRYIGTDPSISGESIAWSRIKTRGGLGNFNAHKVMKAAMLKTTSALWDASTNTFEVYGNKLIENGLVEAVFGDPLSIPLFNEEFDDYPMPADDISYMEQIIFKTNTAIIVNANPDYQPDSGDIFKAVQQAINKNR